MNKEEFDKIRENVYRRICLHQAMDEPIPHDLDNLIKLLLVCEKLENRINKSMQLRDKFSKENTLLIFENNELIKFMNELGDVLKGQGEEE